MNAQDVLAKIKTAIDEAPRNGYMAEFHVQIIKYSDFLRSMTAKEFCEGVGVNPSFGTEFSKMRKIADRLKAAGLDASKI